MTAWRRRAERRGPYVARAVAQLRSWPALAVSDTRRAEPDLELLLALASVAIKAHVP